MYLFINLIIIMPATVESYNGFVIGCIYLGWRQKKVKLDDRY